MFTRRGFIGASIATAIPALCIAHHSFSMFDAGRKLTLHGQVKAFRWGNPHVFIQLIALGEGVRPEEWSIEMTSPEHLARAGWKPGTLRSGDEITVTIHPMRDGTRGGQYLAATGADGAPIDAGAARRADRSRGAGL